MSQPEPIAPLPDVPLGDSRIMPLVIDSVGADAAGKREAVSVPLHRRRAKRVFDIVLTALILAYLAPLLGLVYCLVRRDGGPALYGHKRIGAGGEAFKCWKFRTMVVDAEAVLKDLLERDPVAAAEWQRDFKLKKDPRVTAVGRFLRATSLDELPQLFNVLRGEMSLVGPRPIVRDEMARYGANIVEYLSCRPGLTGLWQVSGRNDVSYRQRVALDTDYVRHWSLRRDIEILLRTIGVVLRRSGAY